MLAASAYRRWGPKGVATDGDRAKAIKARPDHLDQFPVVAASGALKCLGFATRRGRSWGAVTGSAAIEDRGRPPLGLLERWNATATSDERAAAKRGINRGIPL